MSPSPSTVLLGFDAREMGLDFKSEWSLERQAMYLLRSDIDKPLSADTMVWPSILTDDDRQELAAYRGPLNLITDLAQLHDYLRSREPELPGKFCLIAIEIRLPNMPEQTPAEREQFAMTRPAIPDPAWTLLGYDVSDRGLLSGLTNCGYLEGEREGLRRQFGPALNSHHLFDDPAQAMAFKSIADTRIREHAPFFVYGLYLISD